MQVENLLPLILTHITEELDSWDRKSDVQSLNVFGVDNKSHINFSGKQSWKEQALMSKMLGPEALCILIKVKKLPGFGGSSP